MKSKHKKMGNLKEDYHKLLTKVGKEVDIFLRDYYKKEVYPKFPEKKFLYKKMLDKKYGTQKFRATLVYLSYCAFKGKKIKIDKNILRLMVAVELINWSSYELNWIFDKKGGVTSQPEIKKALLAMEGFLHDALNIVNKISPEYTKLLIEINDRIARGFAGELELDINNEKVLKDFDYFWKFNKMRNLEAVGQFMGNCVSLAYICSGVNKPKLHKKLKKICEDFGEYYEISNDLGDFILPDKKVITMEKISSDQLSDLRNETVTLPIWFIYNKASEKDKIFLRSLSKKEITQNDRIKALKLLYDTYAFKDTYKIVRKKAREFRNEINELEIDSEIKGLMEIMISILYSNKFIYRLKLDLNKAPSTK